MPRSLIRTYMLVKSILYVCPMLHCSGVLDVVLLSHGKLFREIDKEGMLISVFYVNLYSSTVLFFHVIAYSFSVKECISLVVFSLRNAANVEDALL